MKSLGRAIAKVSAFWSLVGMATVNLVKISVSANTFFQPSVAGSSCVKSMARTSSGLVVMMLHMGVLSVRYHSYWETQRFTSACIPGQQHHCRTTYSILSGPSAQNHCGLPSGLHSAWHLVLPDTALGGHQCCALSCTTHCLPLQCRPGSSPVVRLLVSLVFILLI